ncbi:type VI secretion system ImpA family N-terminal domain-containing protein [Pseudomonas sp. S 311-6]|uniref:type VI secretion system ImpA family N-terminal domain-containing protein n=1 Tax=Pseudomonas TaxID=286 RepID=UPI002097CC58|nr:MULTISPECIES: type VI secretion system ImpA family N-terminal domain-containing protein [Pseudomonas]MCO7563964.1 type VI secretion system ImpA family N-terminal domain-containing protein [Pseudomonas mosselii]MCO7615537.1 type VI secretion system ImpA family N-terminal domain-containing protein [Pseudomonas guariconensis]MCO7637532.1 type VI secretion system ImpA family N-terminal domain-containing protein [Pseudomonas sp. S 311-6]
MTAMVEETLCLGGDPRGCAEFGMLGGELAKLNHPACPDVDWVRVEQLAITLFREHGVELQSAAAFALACAQRRGLEGMGEGVRLINRLLARDRLWPPALGAIGHSRLAIHPPAAAPAAPGVYRCADATDRAPR